MAGIDPLSLLSTGLTLGAPLFRGITGLLQMNKKVQHTDTTPAAFTERLGRLKQADASASLPGMGMRLNQLGAIQNGVVQNARLGAGSGSDFLAASAAAAAQRQRGEQALGVQAQQYRDRASQQLDQGLTQQAAYQKADQERDDQATAALKGNGLSNLFGGLSDAASAGVYALQNRNTPAPGSADALMGGSGVPTTNAGYQIPYDQGDEYGYPASYRRRSLSSPFRF